MSFALDERLARDALPFGDAPLSRSDGARALPLRRLLETAITTRKIVGRLEAGMSDAFEERENTFEKQFVHDEDLRFKAFARRNKALALWAAEMKGLSPADAEKYVADFVGAQVGRSDDDVAVALREDLARGDIDLSDHRIRRKMDEEMTEAIASIKAGKPR
jgi:hypothetical protein